MRDLDIRHENHNRLALHCVCQAVSHQVYADESGNFNVFVTLYCQNNRQKVCGQVSLVISLLGLVLYHTHSTIDIVS